MGSRLAAGTIFAGRYRIVRPIAAGGMGAVYEVVHLETERRRALKVMLPHILESEELRERFQREAKVAAHVESEFIVDVFDAGFDEATEMPFLVMELLHGEELSKRLKRLRRLPPVEVVAFLHQTALALDKTHRGNIVHRDLKPENLFLTEREDGPPRIKVLDFGIAKIIAETATSGATQSLGTPLYMAPEQFDPRARLTGATDLYALAMVAFTLLAGGAYWADEARGGNVFALANVAMRGPQEPASVRAAVRGVTLPPSFDAWFARATAADPARRFPLATEMIAAMAHALGVPPPGRAAEASSSSAGPAPFSAGDAREPPTIAQVGSGRPAAPWAAPAFTPPAITSAGAPTVFTPPSGLGMATFAAPQAHSTGPATTSTTSAPLGKGRGIAVAIGAAVTVGVLGGAGVYLFMRTSGDPPAPASAGAATGDGTPSVGATASAAVVATVAVVPSVPPSAAPSAIPSATATAAAATTSTASAKAEDKPPPAAKAMASPPAQPVVQKRKYTRD